MFAVQHTYDLDRILSLPWRDHAQGLGGQFGTTAQLVQAMTALFARPGSGARLRDIQAVALAEAHDFGGGLHAIQVGGGKTLITLLAPVVCQSTRALLLVPSRLRTKTLDDRARYAQDWPAITAHLGEVRIETYTAVSRDRELIATYTPDLILADECHRLANLTSTRTKQARRYLEQNPGVRFVGLSGTIAKRSIKDWAHLARWALGRGSPAPLTRGSLTEWASYLDEGVENRPSPGALVRLVPQHEQSILYTDPVTVVRRAYGRRFAATPGVVVVAGRGCDSSLSVALVRYQVRDPALLEAQSKLRDLWVLPDGQPIADAHIHARHERDLALGFFYRWTETAPEKWLDARRAWCKYVRRITCQGKYDTEMQVAQACTPRTRICARRAGPYAHIGGYLVALVLRAQKTPAALRSPEWDAWREIRDTFKPVTEAVWISDEVIDAAATHVRTGANGLTGAPALVWLAQVAAAQKLAKKTGWRYFGAGSEGLEAYLDASDAHVVCSIVVCSDGKNLQARARSVVLSWPRSGKTCEQMIGRTHRTPTDHDHIEVDCFAPSYRNVRDLLASHDDARFLQDNHKTEQKLMFCDKLGWTPRTKHASVTD